MKKRTLAFKLIAGGLVAVLIPLLVVGIFSATRSATALRSAAEDQAVMLARSIAASIDVALSQELKAVTGIATDPVFRGNETRAMSERLTAVMENMGTDYEAIFFLDAQGTIQADGVGGSYVGVDASNRQYFIDARNGRASIGTPARSMVTGNPVAVVAVPVHGPGNRFMGAVCAALEIDFLIDIITDIRAGETGYAFMLDRTATAIAHPRREFILELNAEKLSGMEDVSRRMTAGDAGLESYVFEGIPKVAGIAPVPMTGWSVAFTQDAPEFLAAANQIRNVIILTALIFLLLTGIAIFYFSRRITVPIGRAVNELGDGAEQVSSASSQVSSASQSLAEGASEQASSLEETSSSLEEMSSMTKQNAESAFQADGLMKTTNEVVQRAAGSMKGLTTAMSDITATSEETSKIIKTIDEIAFQTNLLALNAAVEAARAGEAGAGFAVVAEEVRNLAMRAAEAARNTTGLIEGNVKKINEGSLLVEKTSGEFAEVEKNASKVGELVSEISAASQEQAQGIDQINRAVAEMDKVTQQTAANAEESAAASEEMNSQAEQMKAISYQLALIVGGISEKVGSGETARTVAPPRRPGAGKTVSAGSGKRLPAPVRSNKKTRNPDEVIPMNDDADEFRNF